MNPESKNGGNESSSLAGLYPEAFAMALAGNSRSGLALRSAEKGRLNLFPIEIDQPWKTMLQPLEAGPDVIAMNRRMTWSEIYYGQIKFKPQPETKKS